MEKEIELYQLRLSLVINASTYPCYQAIAIQIGNDFPSRLFHYPHKSTTMLDILLTLNGNVDVTAVVTLW